MPYSVIEIGEGCIRRIDFFTFCMIIQATGFFYSIRIYSSPIPDERVTGESTNLSELLEMVQGKGALQGNSASRLSRVFRIGQPSIG